ncbi:hypothetical protein [Promicromonospora iranensis]|uniref:ABC-type multidrug transport system fused ATPase/permease subunit n=1 Tax=Promicromonospora iranensis TaxID=1105144 RepID=A0ABU2CR71_9MICO|nr:hypothetical protein [Promicromonospora iranensis]MDR7383839.1 ABC-type multidrug transport system fused ATPase/permease subunit [Promicromonospora iranensis]
MAQNPSDKPEAAGPPPGGTSPAGPTPSGPPPAGPPPAGARWRPSWRDALKRVLGVVAVIVVVWLLYLFLSAFLPRWWAQVIGNAVDGSFAAGAWWGIVTGAVFTVVPVLFLAQAALPRRSWQLRLGFVVLAVLFAIPNLLTLGIALGTSSAAHAGERILDVDGPAFRGGTAWGAVIGGVVAAVIVTMSVLYRRRGDQLKQFRAKQN